MFGATASCGVCVRRDLLVRRGVRACVAVCARACVAHTRRSRSSCASPRSRCVTVCHGVPWCVTVRVARTRTHAYGPALMLLC